VELNKNKEIKIVISLSDECKFDEINLSKVPLSSHFSLYKLKVVQESRNSVSSAAAAARKHIVLRNLIIKILYFIIRSSR